MYILKMYWLGEMLLIMNMIWMLSKHSWMDIKVMILVDTNQSAGVYYKDVNAIDLPSGIYMYRLKAGDEVFVKKMTLLK